MMKLNLAPKGKNDVKKQEGSILQEDTFSR